MPEATSARTLEQTSMHPEYGVMSSQGDAGPRDPVGDDSTGPGWGAAALIGFRFGTCYFGAFGLVVAVGLIPVILKGAGVEEPWSVIRGIFHAARGPIAWIGEHLLGLRVQSAQVGSDSAFQWTALFCIACLALVGTAVWTVLDRDRRRYDRLQPWVWAVLRLVLAAAMFYFGMAKVIPTQMPFVLNRLVEPYGNFSPTGVLWAQVGISPAYQMVLGLAEVFGGLLLLLPRTTAAGALVCVVDLTQVFLLNMTYDIRLKTVSSQLLLLSLFLLAPYARRLLTAFFTDRAVPAAATTQLFTRPRANRIALIAQACLGVALLAAFGAQGWQQFTRPTPNLYGIWQVETFSAEGYSRDPLLTDKIRWRRVIFDRPFHVSAPVMVTVQRMDDSFEVYGGTIDPRRHFIDLSHRIELGTYKETPTRIRLTYWWPGQPDQMIVDGDDYAGHKIHLRVTRMDPASFPLVERGFNWVQEMPYNR
ncbi:DoxX family protein [Mycobacteroides abscessus]|uniref:DoxX family protein n=1 Tax=Mycobacteroides abscessus TaxID=36809 RepID=UPI0009418386|nr:DoxX family protein [Mycobacteroides abscessus]